MCKHGTGGSAKQDYCNWKRIPEGWGHKPRIGLYHKLSGGTPLALETLTNLRKMIIVVLSS
jgi:hypothetical protein